MRKLILALLIAGAAAQTVPPQVALSGNIGPAGIFPLFNHGTVIFAADANQAMAYTDVSSAIIRITSAVSLTAPRNLTAPAGFGFGWTFYNDTTGGQPINICGPSGTCAAIPNDGLPHWAGSDGTNYLTSPGSGCTPSLTTTGTSGPATLAGCAFNIPQYVAPSGAYLPLNFSSNTTVSTTNGASLMISNLNTGQNSPTGQNIGMWNYGPGYNNSTNATTALGWSTFVGSSMNLSDAARGISQGIKMVMTKSGQGDDAGFYMYHKGSGGQVDASGEGVNGMVIQNGQKGYPTGTVAGSPATGATSVQTTGFSCNAGDCTALSNYNTWDDGFILYDQSQAIGTATLATSSAPSGFQTYTLSGGTVTPSNAYGLIGASCTNNGNGRWQLYTSTTCPVTSSTGTFVTGTDVCLSGLFQEEAAVTAVSGSTGSQSVTFSTRYAWNLNYAMIMQGGPCGQSIVATASIGAWPIAYAVVGATNSTTIITSNCVGGVCAAGGNILPAATPVTFYPSAFITGSDGAETHVYLGTNHLSLANGDVLVEGPAAQYSQVGIRLALSQTTPSNNSGGIVINDTGPFPEIPFQATSPGTTGPPEFLFGNGYYGAGLILAKRPTSGPLIGIGNGAAGSTAPYPIFNDASSFGNLYYAPVPNTFTFSGQTIAPSLTATGGASTVTSGQISYGGTTAAASNCGSLSGSAGCIVVNVGGTQRYIPYW